MKDEGNNNNRDNENRGGGDKEEPVSNLKCPAQHFRHSAETEGGSRPGNTENSAIHCSCKHTEEPIYNHRIASMVSMKC